MAADLDLVMRRRRGSSATIGSSSNRRDFVASLIHPSLLLPTKSCEQRSVQCRGGPEFVLMPEFRARIVRQVAERDPDSASLISSEIFATDLLQFRRKVTHAIWIQGFRVAPSNFGGLGVDYLTFAFPVGEVLSYFIGFSLALLFLPLMWSMDSLVECGCLSKSPTMDNRPSIYLSDRPSHFGRSAPVFVLCKPMSDCSFADRVVAPKRW